MTPPAPPHHGGSLKALAAVIIAGLVIVMVLLVVTDVAGYFSLQAFEDTILSWGPYGVVLSIALMVLHTFVPFPAEILAIANGMVYGPIWGIVITWVGAMLGASVAFALARKLGRPFVEHWVRRREVGVIDKLLQTDATYAVLVSRFIPVIAFNLVNFVAGLLHISWCRFLVTTAIGILPMTILMVLVGDSLHELSWMLSAAIILLILLSAALIHFIKNSRWFNSREAPLGQSIPSDQTIHPE